MRMIEKILVVEDHADTRDGLAKILELEGYVIVTAEDGREGLKIAQEECPNLILTDVMMPNMDGIEMIKLILEQSQFSYMPIMVLSAYIDNASDAMKAGANSVLPKPVDAALLIRNIDRLLA